MTDGTESRHGERTEAVRLRCRSLSPTQGTSAGARRSALGPEPVAARRSAPERACQASPQDIQSRMNPDRFGSVSIIPCSTTPSHRLRVRIHSTPKATPAGAMTTRV